MSGVEILATEEVVVNTVFNWKVYGIVFAICFVVMFIIALMIKNHDCLDWSFVATVTIVCGTMAGVMFGCLFGKVIFPKTINYETQYKCIISNEVSMNEFTEKYEIIDQDGKIYTVREKET